jgi:fatty acid desaturase
LDGIMISSHLISEVDDRQSSGNGTLERGTITFGVPYYGAPPPGMPIPNVLNWFLVGLVFSAGIALLWLGSQATAWYAIALIGVAFSYLMLTNYALLHEAAHGNLNFNPHINYLLGVITGALFPIPFRLMRTTHQNHHLHNRTDHEMFDLYYPSDNQGLKWIQWYGILGGLFWPFVPLGALIFALWPRLLIWQMLKKSNPARGVAIVAILERKAIQAIRLEVLLIIVFFCALFWLLDLKWLNTLVLYACFSLNWSTRQYVGHAFSRRDIVDGAWNLKHVPWMSWLLLHGEWDLNHHRRPDVSWYYLPRLSEPGQPRLSYWKQYWRQWLGPRPCQEAEPTIDHCPERAAQ